MRFDLHVHTSRYSGCSKTPPEEMAQRAQQVGLDGIVITEHGRIWSDEEHAALQSAFPELVILRGVEVRSAFGDDFLIYGTLDSSAFWQNMEAEELFEKAEALGCAVVLAHPYRYDPEVDPAVFSRQLDALECLSFHVRGYMESQITQLQRKLELPCFASSDAHDPEVVGLYGLEFHHPISSEKELAESLKQKHFSPFVEEERVEEFNAQFRKELPEVKKLLAQGKEFGEIHGRYPRFNWGMLKALKAGGDIELLYRA
ncbi:MAG: PHP domain-containing protein [Firmicutes bacterium]|nr:PHP domain-containing protein [Bacillota bacterium]HOB21882.1 PHP-associated domain-containing protein [Bacillota bacterium]HQD39646.1 PHP-associated domain-containing protein [Bacillota bacterium]